MGEMTINVVPVSRGDRSCVIGERVKVDDSVSGYHVVDLRRDVLGGCALEVLGFLLEFEVVRLSLVCGGWNVVVRGSGIHVAGGPVNVGVGVWAGSVGVGFGLVERCWVGGADAGLVWGSSSMIFIVEGSVLG